MFSFKPDLSRVGVEVDLGILAGNLQEVGVGVAIEVLEDESQKSSKISLLFLLNYAWLSKFEWVKKAQKSKSENGTLA